MSWALAITGSVAGTVATVKFVDSVVQRNKAKKALAQLQQKEMAKLMADKSLTDVYEKQMAIEEGGYTPEEEAAYKQQINRLNTAKYNQALMSGAGTMAGAVGAGIQYGNVAAEQGLFINEGDIKRDALLNQGTIAQQLQRIREIQYQNEMAQRINLERAYGTAMATQSQNMINAVDEGANAAGMGSYAAVTATNK